MRLVLRSRHPALTAGGGRLQRVVAARAPLPAAGGGRATVVAALLAAYPGNAALLATAVTDVDQLTPLILAAERGHTAVVKLLLEAAPATVTQASGGGSLPLHYAAENGSTGPVRLLLAAAPAAASVRGTGGHTPLHLAAGWGGTEATRLLLAAAPKTATSIDGVGHTPLHCAASTGRDAATFELLLAAAPQAAEVRDNMRYLPLERGLIMGRSPPACLLAAGPAVMVLQALLDNGSPSHFANFITAPGRLPLSEVEWALVPEHCDGLGAALPAALAHSTQQAARLVQHLPVIDAERLRTAALCLARGQQRSRVCLPTPIVWRLLSLMFEP